MKQKSWYTTVIKNFKLWFYKKKIKLILKIKSKSKYTKNSIFLITVLFSNGFRDFILVLIDIGMNIYLGVKLREFLIKKEQILSMSIRTQSDDKKTDKGKISRNEIKNTITTFVLSLFSIIQSLVIFMVWF